MRYLFFILFCFMFYGCGSIPKDLSPAPIDNNLFTAELEGCYGKNLGLSGCYYSTKEDLNKKFLSLNLLHKGEYEIKSSKCSFNKVERYSGSKTIQFSVEELIAFKPADQLSCVFDVKIFVDGLDRGFRGMFILINKEDFKTASASFVYGNTGYSFTDMGFLQIREGSQTAGYLKFKSTGSGEIIWAGCELVGEKKFKLNPEISLKEIFDKEITVKKSCILEVGILHDDPSKESEVFTFNIQVFSKSIVSLADPVITKDKNKITITADPVVAVASIDNKYRFNHSTKNAVFKFRKVVDGENILRLVTSNGRHNLYKILNGKVVWKPLIIY